MARHDCYSRSMAEKFHELLQRRIKRREFMAGAAMGTLAVYASTTMLARAFASSSLAAGMSDKLSVAEGFSAQVLLKWGEPILPKARAFSIKGQSKANQLAQFGYNNDFLAYLPLPRGSNNSTHGLLCANHEYTDPELMGIKDMPEQVDIDMAAHGHSVVEIEREGDSWQVRYGDHNRRFSAHTEFAVSGPAAGHVRLKTTDDLTGKKVMGTFNNCSGGVTPWGTVLVAEENIHKYFSREVPEDHPEKNAHKAMSLGNKGLGWEKVYKRFDLSHEPHEPNRFGWVWEYDPYIPLGRSIPVKRTALGRFMHEGATCALTPEGRVAVYSGDDAYDQCLYRYLSNGTVSDDPAQNASLLDDGVLYAAKFTDEGLEWLPLVQGKSGLTAENGFPSQGDICIDARLAAHFAGATQMDRPEGVAVHPRTGEVFVALTENPRREEANPANPRAGNRHGHIVRLLPPMKDGKPDHGAGHYTWEIFILAGDPANAADGAHYPANGDTWLSRPDNLAIDPVGNLWIATDGQPEVIEKADSLYHCSLGGAEAGRLTRVLNAPVGAEVTGQCFTPDGSTVFVSIQHPGEDSGYATPSTRWPDFDDALPPRPAVLALLR